MSACLASLPVPTQLSRVLCERDDEHTMHRGVAQGRGLNGLPLLRVWVTGRPGCGVDRAGNRVNRPIPLGRA